MNKEDVRIYGELYLARQILGLQSPAQSEGLTGTVFAYPIAPDGEIEEDPCLLVVFLADDGTCAYCIDDEAVWIVGDLEEALKYRATVIAKYYEEDSECSTLRARRA